MSLIDTLAGDATARKPTRPAGIDVIPYFGDLDANAWQFIPWFYNEFLKDDLLGLYFPGDDAPFCNFVALLKGTDTRILLVVTRDAKGDVIDTVGLASWQPTRLNNQAFALAGFMFLKRYWDHSTSDLAASKIMHFWFDGEQSLDVVCGLVAADNAMAQRFLQRIGWVKSGVIPKVNQYQGKPSDTTLWHITREMFEAQGRR